MKQKELFWISVTVFLTIVAWMLLDLYRAKTETKIDPGFKSIQKVDFTLRSDYINFIKEKIL